MREKCTNHPDTEAFNLCHSCNRYYCKECLTEGTTYYYCSSPECRLALQREKLPQFFTCPECRTDLELSPEEQLSRKYWCPVCNRPLEYVEDARKPLKYAVSPVTAAGSTPYSSGAAREQTADVRLTVCPHCGADFELPPEAQSGKQYSCPGCGRQLEYPGKEEELLKSHETPVSAPDISTYASAEGRGRWVSYLLTATIVVAVLSILSNYMQINLLSRAASGELIGDGEATANDNRQVVVSIAQFLLYFSTGILFLMWFHRAHRNLPSLGVTNLRFTPRWAVGCFFVPIISLVRPFQVAREIWNASDPESTDPRSWRNLATPAVVGWWWGMFLATAILAYAVLLLASGSQDTIEGIQTGTWWLMVSDLTDIPAATVTIQLVRGIDERQAKKFSTLATMVPHGTGNTEQT